MNLTGPQAVVDWWLLPILARSWQPATMGVSSVTTLLAPKTDRLHVTGPISATNLNFFLLRNPDKHCCRIHGSREII